MGDGWLLSDNTKTNGTAGDSWVNNGVPAGDGSTDDGATTKTGWAQMVYQL